MKVMFIGAHPDDFELGCAGTILKYKKARHDVKLVTAIIHDYENEKARLNEARNAAKVLDSELEFLGIKDSEAFFSRKLVNLFDEKVSEFKPDVIFTHWDKDSHADHRLVADLTIAASRKNVFSVFMYEQSIPGGIVPEEFSPKVYVDISEEFDKKIECLNAYRLQKKKYGSSWLEGIEARARYRGFQIKTKYAEAFQVVKEIKKI